MTTQNEGGAPTDSLAVRTRLAEALELDLVGPWAGHPYATEQLPGRERPSNRYLTGFLIPSGTPPDKNGDSDEDEDDGVVPESAGLAEESNEDRKAAKKGFFPSSMGLSFLVPRRTREITVTVGWGEYTVEKVEEGTETVEVWQRTPREALVPVTLTGVADPVSFAIRGSRGLQLEVVERQISAEDLEGRIPDGTRSVSVFLVNHREPVKGEDGQPDLAYVFQPELEVRSEAAFVPRPDLRGAQSQEWDERVSDLHYADTPEYATGHGVSADWEVTDGACHLLRTAWIPSAQVEKTETVKMPGVELSMQALGALADGVAVTAALTPLVAKYRAWIEGARAGAASLEPQQRESAEELLRLAGVAATRIEHGISVLNNDADALDAFRVANRAVARALQKRREIEAPEWHAFQLAFVLLNLPGLADPNDPNRNTVDLLFFPTGGGKTEAYLGLLCRPINS